MKPARLRASSASRRQLGAARREDSKSTRLVSDQRPPAEQADVPELRETDSHEYLDFRQRGSRTQYLKSPWHGEGEPVGTVRTARLELEPLAEERACMAVRASIHCAEELDDQLTGLDACVGASAVALARGRQLRARRLLGGGSGCRASDGNERCNDDDRDASVGRLSSVAGRFSDLSARSVHLEPRAVLLAERERGGQLRLVPC
jgi:hypothetical protein